MKRHKPETHLHEPRTKYNNKVISTPDGVFHSKKEYARWCKLKLLELASEIDGLERQVRFIIIEKNEAFDRNTVYIADFVYRDRKSGEIVVEDVKGYRKGAAYQIFVIKKKLMYEKYKIVITEI